jgi:hypothetical protein
MEIALRIEKQRAQAGFSLFVHARAAYDAKPC